MLRAVGRAHVIQASDQVALRSCQQGDRGVLQQVAQTGKQQCGVGQTFNHIGTDNNRAPDQVPVLNSQNLGRTARIFATVNTDQPEIRRQLGNLFTRPAAQSNYGFTAEASPEKSCKTINIG